MKTQFRRYPLLTTAVTIFVILVAIAILIQIFRQTNFVAAWIFNFVNDWATSLSAAAAVFIIFMAWITMQETMQENRRDEALKRIFNWAKETIRLLNAHNYHEVTKLISLQVFEGYAMIHEARWWPQLQMDITKANKSLDSLCNVSVDKIKSNNLTNQISQEIVTFVSILESASKL